MKTLSESHIHFIINLLKLVAEHDGWGDIFWDVGLQFSVLCNDFFYWGCADAESITPETLPELRRALEDAPADGLLLYCARRRKERPQGAYYKYLGKENWALFDACGPEREVGMGNPHKPGEGG
tara:strand:- start:723 stop:1094 length:372 start_codon:yes stop_codon:yes gene_type:complete